MGYGGAVKVQNYHPNLLQRGYGHYHDLLCQRLAVFQCDGKLAEAN